jgi:fructose transport system substrate-binding protein
MLDLAVSQPTVGVLRDQGFLTGFGIDVKDPPLGRRGRSAHRWQRRHRRQRGRRPPAMENLLAKSTR